MGKILLAEDFSEGGRFHHLTIPKMLPVPREILDYIYEGECCRECIDVLTSDCQINLLIRIWSLKGIPMYGCICSFNNSNQHFLEEAQHDEQFTLEVKNELSWTDFQRGGQFAKLKISSKLPLNQEIFDYLWGELSYIDQIPDGTCLKSKEYQIKLLQKIYKWRYDRFGEISPCLKHLVLYKK